MSSVNTNFRRLAAACRHGEIKLAELKRKTGVASSFAGRDRREGAVGVGVALFDDIQETIAGGREDEFVLRVERHVVGVAGDGHAGDLVAGEGVQDDELSGPTTADEETVVGLVQSDWVVARDVFEWPRRKQGLFLAVDHGDLIETWRVGKDAASFLFDNEALGLGRELDFSHGFAIGNANNGIAALLEVMQPT